MKRLVHVILFLLVLVPAVIHAQPPNFAGTWGLDEAESRIDAQSVLIGLDGTGGPRTLHITQPANGTLVLESSTRNSQARLYRPGAETSTPILLGEAGVLTMTSRWDRRALASEGSRTFSSGDAPPESVKETLALSADGARLEIEASTTRAEGTSTSRFTYKRVDTLGPCETWPSPCKKPESADSQRD